MDGTAIDFAHPLRECCFTVDRSVDFAVSGRCLNQADVTGPQRVGPWKQLRLGAEQNDDRPSHAPAPVTGRLLGKSFDHLAWNRSCLVRG